MQHELDLHVLSLLTSYLLRTLVAFFGTLLINRIMPNASVRFRLWLIFLVGSGMAWVATAASLLNTASPLHHALRAAGAGARYTLAFAVPRGTVAAPSGNPVLLFYLSVVFVLLTRYIACLVRVRRLVRYGSAPSSRVSEIQRIVSSCISVRDCDTIVLAGISSPATLGWRRPVLLLPTFCEDLDDNSVGDMLLHELTHVCRRDYCWDVVASLTCCILFFHPAVWFARERMRVERELACDGDVLRVSGDRIRYAESILHVAKLNMLRDGCGPLIDFAAGASVLSTRLRSILQGPAPIGVCRRVFGYMSAGVVTCAVCSAITVFGIDFRQVTAGGSQAQHTSGLRSVASSRPPHPARVWRKHRVPEAKETTEGADALILPDTSTAAAASHARTEHLSASTEHFDHDALPTVTQSAESAQGEVAWSESVPGMPSPRNGVNLRSLISIGTSQWPQSGKRGGQKDDHDKDDRD